MAVQDARVRGGSLKILMDEVEALNARVSIQAEEDGWPMLAGYRWRPGTIDAPAIYNLLGESPLVLKDNLLHADNLSLITRVAVAYGDDASEMGLLEFYVDIFRNVWDPAVRGGGAATLRPFNGAAIWAIRSSLRSVPEEFNGVPYAAIEFVTSVRMDRSIV